MEKKYLAPSMIAKTEAIRVVEHLLFSLTETAGWADSLM